MKDVDWKATTIERLYTFCCSTFTKDLFFTIKRNKSVNLLYTLRQVESMEFMLPFPPTSTNVYSHSNKILFTLIQS